MGRRFIAAVVPVGQQANFMNTTVLGGVLVVLLMSAACADSAPTSPTNVLSGPSRTFVFGGELDSPVGNATKNSRYVLYDNGAFTFEYVGRGFDYQGAYTKTEDVLKLTWPDTGAPPLQPGEATGSLNGNSLTVRYNNTCC